MKNLIHVTPVRINLEILRQEVSLLQAAYNRIGTRETTEGRSAFSKWNNLNHFLTSVDNTSSEVVINVEGSSENNSCARIYYKPSITSLTKEVRKAIIPTKDSNKFLFFDLKAAEFFLFCYFAKQDSVVSAYLQGNDPYDALSKFFPSNVERNQYKTALISSLYGGTSYSVSKRVGCTEAVADRLLECVRRATPDLENLKRRIISTALHKGTYAYPTKLDMSEYNRVPYKYITKTKRVEFNPNHALSTFTQSALGFWMQNLIKDILQEFRIEGTILSIFDSLLIECSPEQIPSLQTYLSERIKPFRTGKFTTGSTFYEAYVA